MGQTEPVLRVAWDVRQTRRNRTGTGVYATRLLEHLAEQPGVSLLTLDGWHLPQHGPQAEPRRPGLLRRAARVVGDLAWTQVGLPAALAWRRPDLLHAPAYVAPLWSPCPLVVTVHDTIYRRYPGQYARWWVGYLEALLPRVLRRAAAVIAVSEQTRRDVCDAYRVDPERVRVVHHGVDHRRLRPEAALTAVETLRRYAVRDGYVLHVGALVARKRIPLLLEAVALLRTRGEWGERQVVVVGAASPGMPGEAAVREAVARLELGDVVALLGHVPEADLPALYARAAALALPSQYEGFGFPALEAMACGTPVVAAAGSSVSEVVGSAGLLVSEEGPAAFADALRAVLTAPAVRERLRALGLARAAAFTWERCARETVEVYRAAVRRVGGRAPAGTRAGGQRERWPG